MDAEHIARLIFNEFTPGQLSELRNCLSDIIPSIKLIRNADFLNARSYVYHKYHLDYNPTYESLSFFLVLINKTVKLLKEYYEERDVWEEQEGLQEPNLTKNDIE